MSFTSSREETMEIVLLLRSPFSIGSDTETIFRASVMLIHTIVMLGIYRIQ